MIWQAHPGSTRRGGATGTTFACPALPTISRAMTSTTRACARTSITQARAASFSIRDHIVLLVSHMDQWRRAYPRLWSLPHAALKLEVD